MSNGGDSLLGIKRRKQWKTGKNKVKTMNFFEQIAITRESLTLLFKKKTTRAICSRSLPSYESNLLTDTLF